MESEDILHARLFVSVLEALGGDLERNTMNYIVSVVGLQKYSGIETAAQLSTMLEQASHIFGHGRYFHTKHV